LIVDLVFQRLRVFRVGNVFLKLFGRIWIIIMRPRMNRCGLRIGCKISAMEVRLICGGDGCCGRIVLWIFSEEFFAELRNRR
jgi:hypothetical protein